MTEKPQHRKLIVALAVRNQGSRLYGKPLQNLDITNSVSILDFLIAGLSQVPQIEQVVLGISEGAENVNYKDYAKIKGLNYVVGDQKDVLSRLIQCADLVGATEILRVTSESPFPHYEAMEKAIEEFRNKNLDALFLDDIVDGCGFELIKVDALKKSHLNGSEKHRSELCTLFIRENKEDFNLIIIKPESAYFRKDLRLTVDYPEDLIFCRAVYSALKHLGPQIPLNQIIQFLDSKEELKKLIAPFSEAGYQLMYK